MCSTADGDDWRVWWRLETWVWAVLLLVQLSMVAFVVIHGRKDKTFRQAFYVFFAAVTLVDCALVLLRPVRGGRETIFGTVYHMSTTQHEDPVTHTTEYYPTVGTFANQITQYAVVPVLGHAQSLFLTAIAVNRFTAFAFPLKHASMWRTRTVVVVTASLAALSIVLGAGWPVAAVVRQALKCSRVTQQECDDLHYNDPLVFAQLTLSGCFRCNYCLHSKTSFYFSDNPEAIGYDLGLDLTLADWAHSSEWLAGMNGTRKWSEVIPGWLQFKAGCAVAKGHDDEARPMCPAWYRMLIGELRLREDPDFTLRSLELCLFALSGSVFLLLISGNVRTTYFKFYLKWQCLEGKRGQHSSAKVFIVTSKGATTSSLAATATMSTSSRP